MNVWLWILRTGAAALAATSFSLAAAVLPDDARESRWATEVTSQIVVGDPVWLSTPSRAKVLALHARPDGTAKASVVLVHGLGVHPDFGMIGTLRAALVDRGYETLSVQMPVLAADAPRDDYRELFAPSAQRIESAVAWLRGHGAKRVVLLSHSMGSAMSDAYVATARDAPVDGWIAIGMTVDFSQVPRVPVLDVVAESDFPEALATGAARAVRLPKDRCSGRRTVAGADHYFESATSPLVDAILPFLDAVARGAC